MPHHWRPLAHERNSIFKCKQTVNGPWGPEKYDYTMIKYKSHAMLVFEHTPQNQAVRDHPQRHMTFMHKGKNTYCWNNGERLDIRTCGWNDWWFRSYNNCVCSGRHCCIEDVLVNDLNFSLIGISKRCMCRNHCYK